MTDRSASVAFGSPSEIDAEDDVCPTCGQLTGVLGPTREWRSTPWPWWPTVLVLAGLYLVVVYGLRAWTAHQSLPSTAIQVGCSMALEAGHGFQSNCVLARQDLARYQRSIVCVAVGLVAVALGVPRIARRASTSQYPHDATSQALSAWEPLISFGMGAWALGEAILLSCFRLALVVTGYVVLSRIVLGEAPSLDLLNGAIDRTLDAAAAVDLSMLSRRLP